MKKIILALTAITLVSCSGNEGKMKEEIKTYLDKKAKDPKSYEFVDLKITDTVTSAEAAQKKITRLYLDNLDTKLLILKLGDNEIFNDTKKEYNDLIQRNKKDSIAATANLKNEKVIGYITEHTYRLKNGFGALDLSTSFIEFDADFKLLNFGEEPDYSVFKN